jgi:hypothetical protein
MKIELSDETADQLIRDILIQDYRMIAKDIKNLQSQPDLKNFEREDLENSQRTIAAMKIILEYYVGYNWQEQVNA